ncbi:MAG: DNA adenine methylase [Ignavibacteriaceae bacterium]|nr:DNA adenine methylase [Ignavibacteriaceae bacterium]
MLFKEYLNFDYKFPEPQYLGAKHTHLSWIKKFIPKNVNSALDAFAGSQSVAFLFKQLGFETITNDFLNFNHQIGLALIENERDQLTKDDFSLLLQPAINKSEFQLISSTYSGVFFEEDEAEFLDNLRANISFLPTKYKRALAYALINRSMTRKVTMGHFGHTQALKYASDPERIKRNRSLIRPIKDIFEDLIPSYNAAIFDNTRENRSYNENILDLLPKLTKIDLVYFDPPYCDSHADYQSFYHLLETFTEYWKEKQFINGIKRYEPQRYSGFDKKRDVKDSFKNLFEQSNDIPYWLISYNDRSYPSIDELSFLISKFRDISIEKKAYSNGRGGKGSVAGSHEVLFVCKPKKKHFIEHHIHETSFERV